MTGADLKEVCDKSQLRPRDIIRNAGLNRSHYYDIFKKDVVSTADLERIATAIGRLPGDLLPHTEGVPESLHTVVDLLKGRSDFETRRAEKMLAVLFDIPVAPEKVDVSGRVTTPARSVGRRVFGGSVKEHQNQK